MERETKRNLDELAVKRKAGMRRLKEGVSQSDVARELDVSRQSVSRWAKLMAEYPDDKPWLGRPIGRPAGLSQDQRAALVRMLADRYVDDLDERLTLARAAQLIEERFGLSYSLSHVRAILMGGKERKPRRAGPYHFLLWERIVTEAYPGLAVRYSPRESSDARRRRFAELVREARLHRADRPRLSPRKV